MGKRYKQLINQSCNTSANNPERTFGIISIQENTN